MNKCLLCSNALRQLSWHGLVGGKGDCLCIECRSSFERINSQPVRTYFENSVYQDVLDTIHCLYSYNETMRDYFHRYKFLEDAALAEVFQNDFKMVRPVVPIPVAEKRGALKRSFAPVEAFLPAQNVLPLLIKETDVKQSSKNLTERLSSPNPFSSCATIQIPDEVWLIDDIYTTGTTLHQAALVLKDRGVKKVHGLCLAETLLKK